MEPIEVHDPINCCRKCQSDSVAMLEYRGTYEVRCYNCNAVTRTHSTAASAVDAWNKGITLNRAERRKRQHKGR